MPYTVPGLLDGDSEIGRQKARTEVLARAFADAQGGYFQRQKEYEDAISEAEEEMDRMKKLGIGAVVLGLIVIAFSISSDASLGAIFGVIIALAGAGYAYMRYTDAEERIEENEQNIKANEPDGEVTFVSQIGVPIYLLPYQDQYMLFDGLDTAPQTNLDLANIDVERLTSMREELEERKQTFDEYLADQTVLSPAVVDQLPEEFARALDPDTGPRRIEQPLTRQIDEMTKVAADIDRETIDVRVHANNKKSESVRKLASLSLLRQNGDLKQVETRRSMGESQAIVDEIRGVEEQAVSGDMLEEARDHRDHVDKIATDLADRLQINAQAVTGHYDKYPDSVETAMRKHVCTECLSDRVDDIIDELDLVDEILSPESGSLGMALSDGDLDRGVDEDFTGRIREEIQERIPEMDEELERAFNTLTDLGADGGYCEVHGQVETEPIADSGAVFGEVWRSLYYTFRKPIMESVEELERESEEIRQNKEQKMIDLTQYEQIADRVEQEYRSVQSEYEAARTIENELR